MNQKWLTQLCLLALLIGIFLTGCSNERMELSLGYSAGFAPNPEQLQEYFDVRAQLQAARKEGHLAETTRLQAEMDALILRAQGKVPDVGVFTSRQLPISKDLREHDPAYWRETDAFYQREKARGRVQKMLDQAYRDLGQEHLIGVNLTDAQLRFAELYDPFDVPEESTSAD